jgi:hypothetical protein
VKIASKPTKHLAFSLASGRANEVMMIERIMHRRVGKWNRSHCGSAVGVEWIAVYLQVRTAMHEIGTIFVIYFEIGNIFSIPFE